MQSGLLILVYMNYLSFPSFQEMVTVSVDGSVLDRIAKIMSYLRLGSSGKVLKKKKKDKDAKGAFSMHLQNCISFLNFQHVNYRGNDPP